MAGPVAKYPFLFVSGPWLSIQAHGWEATLTRAVPQLAGRTALRINADSMISLIRLLLGAVHTLPA